MKTSYQNQKVLVLGLGLSGQSMLSFLTERGAHVIGYDDRAQKKTHPCKIYSSIEELNFKEIDFIASSPGIKECHPVFIKAHEMQIPIVSEVELGAREIQTPCIGITGTNGKSTVTSMIAHLLNSANKPACALGNIGVPLTSRIDEIEEKICVLELSSYQTESLKSKFLDLALILNITPDHLDRYGTMQSYGAAKFCIQNALKKDGTLYLERTLSENWKSSISFEKTAFYNDFFAEWLSQLKEEEQLFFGKKSILEKLNYSAAIAAVQPFGLTHKMILEGIQSFSGLPHRCEYVLTLNEVAFYNDSKATNIESVLKAVHSFDSPLLMIMGGQDKGLDFSTLLPYFKNKVKKIYAIGEVRKKMLSKFGRALEVTSCQTLEDALKLAHRQSQSGDTVLLSPACASFDMFRNFEHRGNEFKRIVNQLKGEQS